MGYLRYSPAVFSTLFRFAAYLFLRVVPARHAQVVLPTLFALYLGSEWLFSKPTTPAIQLETDEKNESTNEQEFSYESTLMLSLPTSSRRLRRANYAINFVIILALAEFIGTPFFDKAEDVVFTRIGAVYPDSVKVMVRFPHESEVPGGDMRVVWREVNRSPKAASENWKDGPLLNLTVENDWVSTVKLGGLWPATEYEYALTSNNVITNYPESPIRFKTFPDPRLPKNHFRFVVSSCLTPNFPYAPLQSRRIKGFDLLAKYLWPVQPEVPELPEDVEQLDNSSFILEKSVLVKNVTDLPLPAPPLLSLRYSWEISFTGGDVPVYIGDSVEAYRRLYRRTFQSPSFRKIYERLPIFHTYDDHEIKNNYVGQSNDSAPPFPSASDAFKIYNADSNYDSIHSDQHYFDFRYGDVAFFVVDTRRYRTDVKSEEADPASASMLGDRQLVALYEWLEKVNSTTTFKFIVTSVPFTSLWGHDAKTDSWAAYPQEKDAILTAIQSVPNVIILSGDRHEFAAIEYNTPVNDRKIYEFSTSPLSMFDIPFIRTLTPASVTSFNKTVTEVYATEEGGTEEVTSVEVLPLERVVKYIARGNYKWSAIEVDTRDYTRPTVSLELSVDGAVVYNFDIVGSPVKLQSSTALGAFVPSSFKTLLDKMGIKASKWF